MAMKRNSPRILVFAAMLASVLVMASLAISATPEPTASQPKIEVTTSPTTFDDPKAHSTGEQKSTEKQEKEKNDKKKESATGMLLTLFAIITGHQSATH